jgi:anaerobic selenocysteine-containing dehydrogenase
VPAVWKAILDHEPYPIKAMLSFWTNPLISYANTKKVYRALKKLEFILSVDFFLNPTGRLAHIVLPAATFLERPGIANYYGQGLALRPMPKVAEPPGECRDDRMIFAELSRRIGMGEYWPWKDMETHMDGLLEPMGITFGQLAKKGQILFPREYRKYEKEGFKTPSKKVEVYSRELEEMGYDPLPVYREPPESPYSTPELAKEFPLVLITGGRTSLYNHTEMRMIPWLREIQPEPVVEIHPETAQAHGIKAGDLVTVESPRGRIFLKADVTLGIDPRVISCKSRWWYPERGTDDESWLDCNSNVLTSEDPPYDPAIGSYQLRAVLCRIGKGE